MSSASTLKNQLTFAHTNMENTIADCTPEVLSKTFPGSTIGSIAGIYAHVVFAEDRQIQAALKGGTTLFESEGWAEKTGAQWPQGAQDLEWRSNFQMDLPSFRQYAAAVYAATDAFLDGLTEDELAREFGPPERRMQVETFLTNFVATHPPTHMGEIAALKGLQGLKGLPF